MPTKIYSTASIFIAFNQQLSQCILQCTAVHRGLDFLLNTGLTKSCSAAEAMDLRSLGLFSGIFNINGSTVFVYFIRRFY
jgi:hypothetical protein